MYMILLSLAISGFVSSTILPGSSEAAFVAFLLYYPDDWLIALVILTITNTLGSLTSFFIAYFIPNKLPSNKAVELLRRYGSPLLFFTFTPIVGDLLPLAAGFIKLPIWRVIFFITLGKFVRYCFIAYVTLLIGA